MGFKEDFKRWRTAEGVTQHAIDVDLELSSGQTSRWERGKNYPPMERWIHKYREKLAEKYPRNRDLLPSRVDEMTTTLMESSQEPTLSLPDSAAETNLYDICQRYVCQFFADPDERPEDEFRVSVEGERRGSDHAYQLRLLCLDAHRATIDRKMARLVVAACQQGNSVNFDEEKVRHNLELSNPPAAFLEACLRDLPSRLDGVDRLTWNKLRAQIADVTNLGDPTYSQGFAWTWLTNLDDLEKDPVGRGPFPDDTSELIGEPNSSELAEIDRILTLIAAEGGTPNG